MYIAMGILIMALVTYMPRVLPVTLCRKKIKSLYIRSFLHYVPYAVLGAMTFPHIFYATKNMYAAVLGALVALLLGYFEKSLTIVAVVSVGVVYCCNLLL